MTDTAQTAPRQSLGVGLIIVDTFSIFFRKLLAIILLAFIPALVVIGMSQLMARQAPLLIDATGQLNTGRYIAMSAVMFLVFMAAACVSAAGIAQLAYDAKLGRPIRIVRYFSAAIRNIPAVLILSIVVTVLLGLVAIIISVPINMLFAGFWPLVILPFVPCIWLMAVFSVFVPAAVIDKAGFGALGRSARLTKNYRWPIIGAMTLVGICMFLFMLVFGVVISLISGTGSVFAIILVVIFGVVLNALSYGIISIAVALIFARLKEIKEGVGVADLVDVFR